MTTPFKLYTDFTAPQADGIKYMLAVGRRQPMHVAHLETLQKILQHGYTLIMVVGSTNEAIKPDGCHDHFFEPIANPLTPTQQFNQARAALKEWRAGTDYLILPFPDVHDNDVWCWRLAESLKGWIEIDGKFPDLSGQTAFHFRGKEEDKRLRRFIGQTPEAHEERLAYFWEGQFDRLGLPVLQDAPLPGTDMQSVSGTRLRQMDLNTLTPEQYALFAVPDYIISEANWARSQNPSKALIAHIPVTTFDLTLQRLAKEKAIPSSQIIAEAANAGGITLPNLITAAREINKRPQAATLIYAASHVPAVRHSRPSP